jgi:hypothetical protein
MRWPLSRGFLEIEVERRRKEPKGNISLQKLTGCDLGADFERNPPPILAKQMEGLRLTGTGPQVLQHPSQKTPVRVTRGEENPAAAGIPDRSPDLQEPEPQGVHLEG